jgi:acetyl esterase/lipase
MPSPELASLLEMLRAMPPLAGDTIDEWRASLEAATAVVPLPEDVRFEPVSAGGVAAEWARAPEAPEALDNRAIVYFHGGGYVTGSLQSHRLLVADLARACGLPVLSVDYRLAPEHPFPAAVEDAVAAYRFVRGAGIPPAGLAFAGDSAGGGLTVAALLALREAGEPLPAAGVCLSPWLDLGQSGASMDTKAAVDPMLSRTMLDVMARAYLGSTDARTPTASPLFADLAGLPPLLLQVGTAEVLLDDSTRFAERARAAGVDVTLEVWADMVHDWQAFAVALPEGREAIDKIAAFVRGALR